jgi:septal ring factor EnvC (AmiA/AmiB activator)
MFGTTGMQEEIEKLNKQIDILTDENDDLNDEVKDLKLEVENLERQAEIDGEDHDRAIDRLKDDHRFELKHFKDEEMKTVRDEVTALTKKIAVLETENKMLGQVMDVNKDIIDVKNLVSTLIDKLPTVNINGVMTQTAKAKK